MEGYYPPRGPVEIKFLKPVLLGESLAPFRVLGPALGVIPADDRGRVLDAAGARAIGARRLAEWLDDCETKWNTHAARNAAGSPKMTLRENIDHLRKLSQQFPLAGLRVVYAASGILPAAVMVSSDGMVVEHACYWTSARTPAEGRFLCALLNSERLRAAIEDLQPKGQGGARHFDNLIWELPIPEYDSRDPLHRDLADLAAECERVAAAVALPKAPIYPATQAHPRCLAAGGLIGPPRRASSPPARL